MKDFAILQNRQWNVLLFFCDFPEQAPAISRFIRTGWLSDLGRISARSCGGATESLAA
ncbi:hypothetical protein [Methylobacterium sp. E-016]|uniref:hypothetical protein n=1 Tax=Methylobacterium sp. E-016 TaxID=2836556 RepID=UPI001FBA46C5|nr:hypothetical protein [Methylobacterium sp. E-016]